MDMVKWLLRYGLLSALLFSVNSRGEETPDNVSANKLVILNWAEYLDPELIDKFEKEFSTDISEIYFESDEHRTQILIDNHALGFDLILTSGINLEPYAHRGWIAPLSPDLIPNRAHINSKWLTAFPGAKEYGVPYFWGTTGILYRKDKIKYQITSWMNLFRPDPILKGKIGMFADGNEIISLALKALGYSLNEGSPEALAQTSALLSQQKEYVRSYQYLSLRRDSEILSGDLWMSIAYSGDALMVMEHDSHNRLNFTIPEEGTNLWVDYFTLGAKANRPDLAYAFINFLNRPDNAAQAALYTYCATPNDSAKTLLPDDYLDNPIIFPDNDVLMKSEQFRSIPPKQLKQRNLISNTLVNGGEHAPEF
ncbi:spermidine/putrescine ABC transporter substrate-binding protein [Vibrio sp. HA2012]|uniref:polyamine ABC transporter substrate-binding protein n=1 Tax=Vibrio sp. HA2012 TaxID=1971595 RepID=UPI000C2C0839|nr:spermidine/putrescine ABC transporter substrate-binding protein [Vibrio sp. HA2012]PJC87288.1 spermidine/putrescine ABC transporter substrate-binding protein [Vibrio sp. HA2012]